MGISFGLRRFGAEDPKMFSLPNGLGGTSPFILEVLSISIRFNLFISVNVLNINPSTIIEGNEW